MCSYLFFAVLFLINLDQSKLIIFEVNIERNSSDPIQSDKYKNGDFLHVIAQVIACLNLDNTPNFVPGPFSTGLDESSFHANNAELLSHDIHKISQDMNCFDSKKHPCAICGQICHDCYACPCLKSSNIKQAYIWLLILLNRFCCNLECFDSDTTKKKNNQPYDLNAMHNVTISQLDALEAMNVTAFHQMDDCWFARFSPFLRIRLLQFCRLIILLLPNLSIVLVHLLLPPVSHLEVWLFLLLGCVFHWHSIGYSFSWD